MDAIGAAVCNSVFADDIAVARLGKSDAALCRSVSCDVVVGRTHNVNGNAIVWHVISADNVARTGNELNAYAFRVCYNVSADSYVRRRSDVNTIVEVVDSEVLNCHICSSG